MPQPKTMHDVRTMRRLPPPMGLRSEISRALQLQQLAGERRRLDRELELALKKLKSVQVRLQEIAVQIADMEGRAITGPIRGGIEAPPQAVDNRHQLTVEY